MSERQYVFVPKELEILSCECEKCGTVLLLKPGTDSVYGAPLECPSCNADLRDFAQAIIHYRAFQRAAANVKLKLRTAPKTSEEI